MNRTVTRRTAVAAVAAAMLLTTAACNRESPAPSSDGTAGGPSGAMNIAVVAKGYASPFWATVKAGAEKAGSDLGVGVTFNGPDNESDINRQVDQLNQAFVRTPSALVFAALDSSASATALDKFKNANIPVVAFDSGVPGSEVPVSTVATDNKAAAAEAAKKMIELTGGKGKIAIICHSQTSVTGTDRRDGFQEYIKANAPDLQIVDIQYNDSDQAKAETQAAAILQANPDLAGLFATDDDGAVASANAVGRTNRSEVKIIGFDSGKVQIDAIKADKISGSITQNPFKMGYLAVETAKKAVEGQSVEKVIDSGFAWYDKTNIDTPEIQEAIYE